MTVQDAGRKEADPAKTILFIDDDKMFHYVIRKHVAKPEHRCLYAATTAEAVSALKQETVNIAFVDLDMEGSDKQGLKILELGRRVSPDTVYVMLTGIDKSRTAVQSIRLGAQDYLVKGTSVVDLQAINEKIESLSRLARPTTVYDVPDGYPDDFGVLIGVSDAIKKVRHDVSVFGKSKDTRVLITGETGTGKEVVAQALHVAHLQSRGGKIEPFIPVNMSQLKGEHLRSELFGHTRGAFTGAMASRAGCFRSVGEGTLFLDEIGEMEAADQAQLLRVLQTMEATPLGGEAPYRIKARIHFATNRNLEADVRDGAFRQDLYFRIATCRIHLVPLRERKEDIRPLVDYFISALNMRRKQLISSVNENVYDALIKHEWPGNVRELYSYIDRAHLIESGRSACLTLESIHISKELTLELVIVRMDKNRVSKAQFMDKALVDLHRKAQDKRL